MADRCDVACLQCGDGGLPPLVLAVDVAAAGPHAQLCLIRGEWHIVHVSPVKMSADFGHGQHLRQKCGQFGPGHALHIAQVGDAGITGAQAGDPGVAGGDAQVVLASDVGVAHACVGHQETVVQRQRDVSECVLVGPWTPSPCGGGPGRGPRAAVEKEGVTRAGQERDELVHNPAPRPHVPLGLAAHSGERNGVGLPTVEVRQRQRSHHRQC